MNADWIRPDWPAPPRVGALCTTRAGGFSAPPYDSLNLGGKVGDDPAAVAENRRRFAEALGARPVFLSQVHAWGVVALDAATPDGTEGDACFTTARGVACTIGAADCLPVLLADCAGSVVGAAHCGWRGLAGGVLEALCAQMAAHAAPRDLLAWLGPCIGPAAFEVGPEVREAFVGADAAAARHVRDHVPGKFLADLPALARQRLARLGIGEVFGNDGGTGWCTVTNRSRFFSHRRDRVSGRLAAAVWLR